MTGASWLGLLYQRRGTCSKEVTMTLRGLRLELVTQTQIDIQLSPALTNLPGSVTAVSGDSAIASTNGYLGGASNIGSPPWVSLSSGMSACLPSSVMGVASAPNELASVSTSNSPLSGFGQIQHQQLQQQLQVQHANPPVTPEIQVYKKRYGSEILCAAMWGVNLLLGLDTGLSLLDRSGEGKGILLFFMA
ncbi:unnamed protein product [Protopolystoma xenopodis]|uniref:Uncharacterized protein n=1 Tax=Protopolystoma xenopodis TaxID=117903 RepID=A0A448XEV3_9PLAT|nr:unnamed protein product [Protopolystoma xenopodis]